VKRVLEEAEDFTTSANQSGCTDVPRVVSHLVKNIITGLLICVSVYLCQTDKLAQVATLLSDRVQAELHLIMTRMSAWLGQGR